MMKYYTVVKRKELALYIKGDEFPVMLCSVLNKKTKIYIYV